MQNNSKQLNAWYEVEVEEGGTKMFVFNYFLLCTRGQAVAAGNTQSSHWKCTEQHSWMLNTQQQDSWMLNTTDAQHLPLNAENNTPGCSTLICKDLTMSESDEECKIHTLRWSTSSSQICKDAHNTTQHNTSTLSDEQQHLHMQRSQWDSHSSDHMN